MTFSRYKKNLQIDDENIYSYGTTVAKIDHQFKEVIVEKHYSMTTSKHINYVAGQLGYSVKRLYPE